MWQAAAKTSRRPRARGRVQRVCGARGGAGAWSARAGTRACGRLWLRLGRRNLAAKTFGVCLAPDAVGLRVLDRGRVTLDPDP